MSETFAAEIEVKIDALHERYTQMAHEMKKAGNAQGNRFFHALIASEQARSKAFLANLRNLSHHGENYAYHVCPNCGYVAVPSPDEEDQPDCPVCKTAWEDFEEFF